MHLQNHKTNNSNQVYLYICIYTCILYIFHLKQISSWKFFPKQRNLQVVIYIFYKFQHFLSKTFHQFYPSQFLFTQTNQTSANGSGRQNRDGIQCHEGQNLSSSVPGAKSWRNVMSCPPPDKGVGCLLCCFKRKWISTIFQASFSFSMGFVCFQGRDNSLLIRWVTSQKVHSPSI